MASFQKVFVVLALFGVSFVVAYKEELRATLKNCKGGADVSDAEIEEFEKPLIPKTNEEKCLMACVFREWHVIDKGHYDPKLGYAVMKDLLKDEPEKLSKIKSVIDHCKDDVPKYMEDECGLADEIMKCYVKWEKEAGILPQ